MQRVVKEIDRTLECKLTEAEEIKHARELARIREEIRQVEGGLESYKSQVKAKLTELTGRMDGILAQIRDGKEYRNVLCEELHDYAACEVRIYRTDNQQLVECRPMTAAEKQMSMDVDVA